jgi:hypothetical protein
VYVVDVVGVLNVWSVPHVCVYVVSSGSSWR